jgi:predicted Zn finger-like uncharacterized protein
MRIACPSCSAAYDVPDSLMTAGRVVRCARCGGNWTPVAAAPVPEPQAEAPQPLPDEPPAVAAATEDGPATPMLARPSAMDRLAAHARPALPPPATRLRLAWAGSLVLLVLVAGAAFAWRGQIVDAWPPSARAYAFFGLQPRTETR